MAYLIVILSSYLLGSIPFGYVLTKFAGMGDIRNIGSGNIGATNVLRTGNKKLAALTLLLDGIKGAVAVLIARQFYPDLAAVAGLAAMLGHLFPVWLKFKGGKGVATAIGVLTALCWPVGLTVMLVWLVVAKVTHYSSLAALVAIAWSPTAMCFFGHGQFSWLALLVAMLVYWKHSANIRRLLNGTESKIGQKSGGPASADGC